MMKCLIPLEEFLPPEFYSVVNSNEFDDEAGILIESVNYKNEDIVIILSVRFFNEELPTQLWELVVTEVADEKITRNWFRQIECYKEHILLLEHNDIQTELYFKGTTTETGNLFIDIYQSLVAFSYNLSDIVEYTVSLDAIKRICDWEHGLFANGPKVILELYATCLIKYGIKPIFLNEYLPGKQLKLLKLGESYFIGNEFLFRKVN